MADQEKLILMPGELSHEAATKRANEQFEENSRLFKNLHRDCTEAEFTRLKDRWLANRVVQLQEQYRALVKVVGVVPIWVATDFLLPDEGEVVLFLDKNDVIHEGLLNTDYIDGPYGENGEDFGDNQTLWTSNSNGEELLLSEVKYWMERPCNPVEAARGGNHG
ncbi:hypothetical protein NGC85_05650 [Acinetobacter sp. Z1]|uniref:hypothetical protein n=1 Tax=Acinetobacter sp. Z1 TaxID=2953738 RepID=UPI0020CA05E0|nr:hypothetical protein [Acinetobacter sp. Z1]UTO20564.1 hypothetical protein NGC85_05650 [Acinetobacter sp. Z1]